MNKELGYNSRKNNILRMERWVLEILIPKTIDKKVFIGYNVDIILFLLCNEYPVHKMNIYADTKNDDLHKIKEPTRLWLLSIYWRVTLYIKIKLLGGKENE